MLGSRARGIIHGKEMDFPGMDRGQGIRDRHKRWRMREKGKGSRKREQGHLSQRRLTWHIEQWWFIKAKGTPLLG